VSGGGEGDYEMRVHLNVELFRSPHNDITPTSIGNYEVTKKGGKLNWAMLKRLIQESADRAEPGRVERINIQIQG